MIKKATYMTMVLFFLCLGRSVQAAEQDSLAAESSNPAYPTLNALNLHVGTTGFGIHFYQPIGSHFGARLGASFAPWKTNVSGTYSGRGTSTDIGLQAHHTSLIFGYTPFSQGEGFFKSFGINVGGAYFFSLKAEMTTRLSDNYQVGDLSVPPAHMGSIRTKVEYDNFVPYAGIGWSKMRLSDAVSLSLDLGTFYLSKPSVSMVGTGPLAGNEDNAATVERNMESYRWLPRVELGVSYSIWK